MFGREQPAVTRFKAAVQQPAQRGRTQSYGIMRHLTPAINVKQQLPTFQRFAFVYKVPLMALTVRHGCACCICNCTSIASTKLNGDLPGKVKTQ